jgi:hypothetical protein
MVSETPMAGRYAYAGDRLFLCHRFFSMRGIGAPYGASDFHWTFSDAGGADACAAVQAAQEPAFQSLS